MRGIVIAGFLASVFWLPAFSVPAWAKDVNYCTEAVNTDDQQSKIDLYTKCIFDGDLSKINLSIAYNNRGNAYDEIGQFNRAVQDYDRAVSLDPNDAAAFINRGVAYGNLGQYSLSLGDYDRAIELSPNNPTAWQNRCDAKARAGEFSDALPDCQQALRLDPDNAIATYSRGLIYEGKGDTVAAINHYRRALNLNPNLLEAKNDLARLGAL